MPALVVPNTVQLRLIWSASAVEFAINVLHFRNSAGVPVDQALANGLASDVTTAFQAALGTAQEINSTTGISRITVRDLNTANQPDFIAAVTGAVGTGTQHLLPRQVSLVVTLRTALAGRSFRGRVYVPGYTELANDSVGRASAVAQSIATGLVGNIRSGVTPRGLVMGVVSTRTNGAPRPTNIITDVTSVAMRDNAWDNQRRRNVVGIGI